MYQDVIDEYMDGVQLFKRECTPGYLTHEDRHLRYLREFISQFDAENIDIGLEYAKPKGFRRYLLEELQLKETSAWAALRTAARFYKYAESIGRIKENPFDPDLYKDDPDNPFRNPAYKSAVPSIDMNGPEDEWFRPLFDELDDTAVDIQGVYRNLVAIVRHLKPFVANAEILKTSAKDRPVVMANHAAYFSLLNGLEACAAKLSDEVMG